MEKIQNIPTIDFSNFPSEYEKLRRFSEEWGCFRIINHKIPSELMQQMKQVVRSLFDLPGDIKKNNVDVIAGSGYWARTPKSPLYEALGLYDMASSQAVHDFCSQLHASPSQRDIIERYAEAIHEMIVDIGGKIGESMGLNGDYCKEWPCQFRINKYHFTPEAVGSTALQIHTDSGFLTILQDDENVGGLEAMDKNGEFVVVDPLPGSFIVNLGDMAHVWSNGKLCNVKHRVQCKEATIRVSIASFLLGPKEAALDPAPELVDSEHPRLYKSFTYEEYRKLRISTKLLAGEHLNLCVLALNKDVSDHNAS